MLFDKGFVGRLEQDRAASMLQAGRIA